MFWRFHSRKGDGSRSKFWDKRELDGLERGAVAARRLGAEPPLGGRESGISQDAVDEANWE